MRQECRECFSRHRGLAIPIYNTARAWRTCRDACRDRKLTVSFEIGGGENVRGIPGACVTRNFTYLARGPCSNTMWQQKYYNQALKRNIWAVILPKSYLIMMFKNILATDWYKNNSLDLHCVVKIGV